MEAGFFTKRRYLNTFPRWQYTNRSLPRSPEAKTCPHLDPDESSPFLNTSVWWRDIYIILLLLLHREQLHVSALDNGHLQVVHEMLIKQLYKHIYIYICQNGWGAWRVHGVIKLCLRLRLLTDTRSRAHFTPPPHISSPYIYIYICVCVCVCVVCVCITAY